MLIITSTCLSQYSDYCSLSPNHIMCKHRDGPSSNCGAVYSRGLTFKDRNVALSTHNQLRSRLATGLNNFPTASNMMQLRWDAELAEVAQRHADQCSFVHDCSDCRRVGRFRVGQNLLREKTVTLKQPDWKFAVQSWFREIKDYPNTDNSAIYRYWFLILFSARLCHCFEYILLPYGWVAWFS